MPEDLKGLSMEKANQILKTFLFQQRSNANLQPKEVAIFLGCTIEQFEAWETLPVKAPLCEIAKLVKLYKTSEISFLDTIWNTQRELIKNKLH